MLSINTNLSSLIAQNSLTTSTNKLNQAIERMTTGFKINHAKDNAANYSIATNLTTKIGAYMVAEDNCAMGLDMLATANGSLDQISDKLSRLRILAEQASNGTYGEQSLKAINAEANALVDEVNRLYLTTEYNGKKLFGEVTSYTITPSWDPENLFLHPWLGISYSETEIEAMTTMSELVNGVTSADSTYSISTVEELQALAQYVNDGNDTTGMTFVLGDNLDLSTVSNWTPIGTDVAPFKGTFHGNMHVIRNLTINNDSSNYQGLFGYTKDGEIFNVGLLGGSVLGGAYVGALVGYSRATDITNCYATTDVTSEGPVGNTGGLIGFTEGNVHIEYCYSTGAVSVSSVIGRAGGLIGYLSSGQVDMCYATGNVTGTGYTGGLVGYCGSSANGGRLYGCHATGSVSGTNYVGGLVGDAFRLEINQSYAKGTVNGTNNVGGLVGQGTHLNSSYSTGSVTGNAGSGETNSADWDGTEFVLDDVSTVGMAGQPDLIKTPVISNIGAVTLQIGINSDTSSQIDFNTNCVLTDIEKFRKIGLSLTMDFLTMLDNSLGELSKRQTELGAVENRLESALDEISTQYENLVSTRSTIRDADIAEVSSEYIRQQILQQASATLMSTANQSPSIALQLI